MRGGQAGGVCVGWIDTLVLLLVSVPPAHPIMYHPRRFRNRRFRPHRYQAPKFDRAMTYLTTIKKRFSHEPQTYNHFLEMLHAYEDGERGETVGRKRKRGMIEVRENSGCVRT